MDAHEVLVAARNLIDREGWRQDFGVEGVERCAVEAISDSTVGISADDVSAVLASVLGVPNSWGLIGAWNDAPERTKQEVLDAFDRAIAATAPPPADPFSGGAVGVAPCPESVVAVPVGLSNGGTER